MSQRSGQFAILTPDARNASLRNAIETVNTRVWTRSNGQTFGPYPHTWDRQDAEVADALLSEIALPDTATFTDLRTILAPLAEHACIAQAISRMDRLRQVGGQNGFSAARVIEFVRDAVRNQSRLGFSRRADLAMTIQRAKNREFPNIIVVWPHSATGSPEHLRRLLYNAITRAQNHCSVIVLGQGRLNAPPFAPAAG